MTYEPANKKRKSAVFSVEDQIRLLEIIEREKEIIENKVTNKIANDDKDMAWQRICTAYNALSVQFRTVDQLKSKYDNLKTKARKVVAENKTYINGTGGGGPNADKFDTVIELILKIINIKTVVGFQNPFDCDNTDPGIPLENLDFPSEESSDQYLDNIPVVIQSIDVPKNYSLITGESSRVEMEESSCIMTSANIQDDNTDHVNRAPSHTQTQKLTEKNWSNYTPHKLRTPVSKKLVGTHPGTFENARVNFYNKKIEYLEQEIASKKEEERRREEEHVKKMKLMDLEIRLKQEEVKTKYNIL